VAHFNTLYNLGFFMLGLGSSKFSKNLSKFEFHLDYCDTFFGSSGFSAETLWSQKKLLKFFPPEEPWLSRTKQIHNIYSAIQRLAKAVGKDTASDRVRRIQGEINVLRLKSLFLYEELLNFRKLKLNKIMVEFEPIYPKESGVSGWSNFSNLDSDLQQALLDELPVREPYLTYKQIINKLFSNLLLFRKAPDSFFYKSTCISFVLGELTKYYEFAFLSSENYIAKESGLNFNVHKAMLFKYNDIKFIMAKAESFRVFKSKLLKPGWSKFETLSREKQLALVSQIPLLSSDVDFNSDVIFESFFGIYDLIDALRTGSTVAEASKERLRLRRMYEDLVYCIKIHKKANPNLKEEYAEAKARIRQRVISMARYKKVPEF